MKSNARAAVLALFGTALILFAAFSLFKSSGSLSVELTMLGLASFFVLLLAIYADRNLKRARRVAPVVPTGPRETGTIKWFNVTKGYGFITREDGDDVFVHYRSLRNKDRYGVKEGMEVNFVIGRSGKGPQAEDVDFG